MRQSVVHAALLAVATILAGTASRAADIVVNSTADSGSACTLRHAIENANANGSANGFCAPGGGADTIRFDPNIFATPQTITLGSRLPILDDAATTTIEGANRVTIDGGGTVQVMWVGNLSTGSGSVVLRDLVIAHGNADGNNGNGYYGGGVFMSGSLLRFEHVTLRANKASFGGAGFFSQGGTTRFTDCVFDSNDMSSGPGGGIYNSNANIEVVRSSFVNNVADSGAGVFSAYGGQVTIDNSTFSGNSGYRGAAIRHFGGTSMTIRFSTLAGNTATQFSGGALSHEGDGNLSISGSVVAGNSNGDCYADGTAPGNAGGNFFGDSSCGATASGSPMLAALGDNGGLTPTLLPAPGSPLLDAASCDTSITTDQRGVARPQGAACDIGAVEIELPIFANGFELTD